MHAQDRAGASAGQGQLDTLRPQLRSGAFRTWMQPRCRLVWLPPPGVSPGPYPGRVPSHAEPRGQKMAGSGQGDPGGGGQSFPLRARLVNPPASYTEHPSA